MMMGSLLAGTTEAPDRQGSKVLIKVLHWRTDSFFSASNQYWDCSAVLVAILLTLATQPTRLLSRQTDESRGKKRRQTERIPYFQVVSMCVHMHVCVNGKVDACLKVCW